VPKGPGPEQKQAKVARLPPLFLYNQQTIYQIGFAGDHLVTERSPIKDPPGGKKTIIRYKLRGQDLFEVGTRDMQAKWDNQKPSTQVAPKDLKDEVLLHINYFDKLLQEDAAKVK